MKFIRLFLFFILAVFIVCVALIFTLPAQQKIERSIVINAPAQNVYDLISKLEYFNKISAWGRQDSSLLYTLTGLDGSTGAITTWKGAPEISGEGKIKIVSLIPNNKVEHHIEFMSPGKGTAISIFNLIETERSSTTITWIFYKDTPRPWNIFNLFYSMDKQMGKDFEDGLSAMKKMIETNDNNPL